MNCSSNYYLVYLSISLFIYVYEFIYLSFQAHHYAEVPIFSTPAT